MYKKKKRKLFNYGGNPNDPNRDNYKLTSEQIDQQKEQAATQQFDSVASKVPVYGQIYGIASGVSDMGRGMLGKETINPETGAKEKQYSNSTERAADAWVKPQHEYITDAAAKGDWGDAALSIIPGVPQGRAIFGKKNDFKYGGNTQLSEFNTGGTHEQNPLGGIPLGDNASVEQGETKWEDYIFSDRLSVPGSKKTFADASKEIQKRNFRKNDPYTEKALKKEMSKLIKLQEEFKNSQDLNDETTMAYGGNINRKQFPHGGWHPPVIEGKADIALIDNPNFYKGIETTDDAQKALDFVREHFAVTTNGNQQDVMELFKQYSSKYLPDIEWTDYTSTINPDGSSGKMQFKMKNDPINKPQKPKFENENPQFRQNPNTGKLEQRRVRPSTGEEYWVASNPTMAAQYYKNAINQGNSNIKLSGREGVMRDMQLNPENITTDYNEPISLPEETISPPNINQIQTAPEEEIILEKEISTENNPTQLAYGGRVKRYDGGLDLSNYNAISTTLNPNTGALGSGTNSRGSLNNSFRENNSNIFSDEEMLDSIKQDKIAENNYRNRGNNINNSNTKENNSQIDTNTNKPFMDKGDALTMGLQALPALYNIGLGLKGSNKIKYDRLNPRTINFDASRNNTREIYDQQGNIVDRQISQTATGSGQALSAKIASANRLAKDRQKAMSEIDERESNINQQIRSGTDIRNLQTSMQEEMVNAQTKGANQTAVGTGLGQLANAAGTINRDRNASNVQENTIKMLSDGRQYMLVYNPETKRREMVFLNDSQTTPTTKTTTD